MIGYSLFNFSFYAEKFDIFAGSGMGSGSTALLGRGIGRRVSASRQSLTSACDFALSPVFLEFCVVK